MEGIERIDVVVIGAGPAGSAMALQLRRAGRQVTLVERARFPRDKLCGEFISAEGVAALADLGLGEWLATTCPEINRVLVCNRRGAVWQERLPRCAVGCTRATLDYQLLQQCAGAGVDVREGVRVAGVDDDGLHQRVSTDSVPASTVVHLASGERLACRLVIYACGRQSALLRHPPEGEHVREKASRWWSRGTGTDDGMLGLKLHTQGAEQLGSTVELHGFDGGYLGLAAVEGERVNVCALVKSSALRRVGKDPQRLADEVMAANPSLASRLEQLQPDWSQALAVANLQFGPAPYTGRLCVGDSAGAIAPLCGDGISMALRAAQLAVPLADRYLDGAIPGSRMLACYRRQWRREFGLRIRLGNQLQALLLSDIAGTLGLTALGRLPALGRWAIASTRG